MIPGEKLRFFRRPPFLYMMICLPQIWVRSPQRWMNEHIATVDVKLVHIQPVLQPLPVKADMRAHNGRLRFESVVPPMIAI